MVLYYIYIKPHGIKSVTLPRISRQNSKDWPVIDRFCHGNLHPVLYQKEKKFQHKVAFILKDLII